MISQEIEALIAELDAAAFERGKAYARMGAIEDDAVKQATRNRYEHYLTLSVRVESTLRSKLAERS